MASSVSVSSNLARYDISAADGKLTGFDFVVAVSQAGLNGTLLAYLSSVPQKEVKVCFVANIDAETGEVTPKEIALADLLELTDGVDPFTAKIPKTKPHDNADFRKLDDAGFMMGFTARIGLPNASDKTKIPDIVTLSGDTAKVGFNLLCAEFTVIELQDQRRSYSWTRIEQDPNNPIVFSTFVDLRMRKLPEAAYAQLTEVVQAAIKNLSGTAFSVQQLLFDLTNARLAEMPIIKGLEGNPTLRRLVSTMYLDYYLAALREKGEPVLGCALVPQTPPTLQPTLTLTDLNFSVNSYVDAHGQPVAKPSFAMKQATTLNYLCAADNHLLAPPVAFPWNWLDSNEDGQQVPHGVVSINRNRMRDWLALKLQAQAQLHCFNTRIIAYHTDDNITIFRSRLETMPNQVPRVERHADGKTVLRFVHTHESEDNDRAGDAGIKVRYSMEVDFEDGCIVVTQSTWVWIWVRAGAASNQDTIVDRVRVDKYPIQTGSQGELVVGTPSTEGPTERANPEGRGGFINFFTHIDDVYDSIQKQVKSLGQVDLGSIPLSVMQGYVFPGGDTFVFKNARFSDRQDLVSEITYASPV